MAQSRNRRPEDSSVHTSDHFWIWFTAISGIVFVVLAIAGFVVGGNDPTPSDSLDTIRAYFVDHRSQVLTSVYLDSLSLAFFLAFAAGLGGLVIRSAADRWGVLSRLMLAGAIGFVSVTLVENMAEAALAFRVASSGDAGAVQALFNLYMMVIVLSFSLAAFLAAAAMGILRGSLLPKWMGWIAFVPALLLVIGAAGLGDPRGSLATVGFVGGYLPFLLWTLAAGTLLISRRNASVARSDQSVAPLADQLLQSGS